MRRIQVKVKPSSGQSRLEQVEDGSWLAWLKSAPVDGKANQELIGLLARQFDTRKSRVTIKAGAGGRSKWVEIADD